MNRMSWLTVEWVDIKANRIRWLIWVSWYAKRKSALTVEWVEKLIKTESWLIIIERVDTFRERVDQQIELIDWEKD